MDDGKLWADVVAVVVGALVLASTARMLVRDKSLSKSALLFAALGAVLVVFPLIERITVKDPQGGSIIELSKELATIQTDVADVRTDVATVSASTALVANQVATVAKGVDATKTDLLEVTDILRRRRAVSNETATQMRSRLTELPAVNAEALNTDRLERIIHQDPAVWHRFDTMVRELEAPPTRDAIEAVGKDGGDATP